MKGKRGKREYLNPVISREIKALAALYPPIQKVLYRAAISSFALDLRFQWSPGAARHAHAYSICALSIVSV